MEICFSGRRVVLMALAVAAALAVCAALPRASEALLVMEAPRDQAVAFILQEILAAANALTLTERVLVMEKLNELMEEMAERKRLYYAMDHRKLQNTVSVGDAPYMAHFAETLSIGTRFHGYRSAPGGNYAEMYKSRADEWRGYAADAASGNGYAAADIKNEQAVLASLAAATDNAYGNLEQIQSGAQINNFLNEQLSKLQVDLGRRLQLKIAVEMNEQQRNADEVSAFGAAVGTWGAASGGDGY
jgi:hypothetical protein